MNNPIKIYIGFLVAVIALLIFLEANKTPVINWSYNYKIEEKSPFGLYVFDQESNSFFNNELEKTTESPYIFLSENDRIDTPKNYLIIQNSFTEEGFYKLLEQVDSGSNLFLGLSDIPNFVADTLGFELQSLYQNDSLEIFFTDKKIEKTLSLDKVDERSVLYKFSPETTQILAYSEDESLENEVILSEIKYGKGSVFILSHPIVFTNYYLLKPKNKNIIAYFFAFMPKHPTIWFQEASLEEVSHSPLRFILQDKSLKSAWYILLISTFLFMFFTAKRKQRIIPIKEPVINKSVEFVKSIGNLYLQEGNHKDMAQKKAVYFLQKVRTELFISTDNLDKIFEHKLQQKTNQSEETITEAVQLIKKALDSKTEIKQAEFIKMNKLLDKIYK